MDQFQRDREPAYNNYGTPFNSFPILSDVMYANHPSSEPMNRDSSISNSSFTSHDSVPIPSPWDQDFENDMDVDSAHSTMAYYSQPPATSFSSPYIAPTDQSGIGTRPTPTSLGWGADSIQILNSYSFKVSKGKEPYFELFSGLGTNSIMPQRVYMDKARHQKKNAFPCQFPGGCKGKYTVFSRPADLERHYKNVHEQKKDEFLCDYPKCARFKDPFSRKDHFRDHLRDYHKEDIGYAKINKKDRYSEQEHDKLQRQWLEERSIRWHSWRCVRCLVKVDVRNQGWDCPKCKTPCEEDRVTVRQLLAAKEGGKEKEYGNGMEPAHEQNGYSSYSGSSTCSLCNGVGWIVDAYGSWQACNHTQEYYS